MYLIAQPTVLGGTVGSNGERTGRLHRNRTNGLGIAQEERCLLILRQNVTRKTNGHRTLQLNQRLFNGADLRGNRKTQTKAAAFTRRKGKG